MKFVVGLNDLKKALNSTLEYEVSFTKEDLEATPNVVKANDVKVSFKSYEADFGYILDFLIEGEATLIDDYSFKEVEYHFENDEEVEVNLDDLDESDVVVDRGQIDLAPVVLALFYDVIPLSYHQEDVKPHSDSYEVISEEEYLKRKKEREKANSPFANIDIE